MPRSNKVGQALQLPTVMNINPRSVYNKPEELQALITEEQIDCVFLSESWERSELTLEELLDDLNDDFRIISNPFARSEGTTGGRPAIIIKKEKYNIKNLTNTVINIPGPHSPPKMSATTPSSRGSFLALSTTLGPKARSRVSSWTTSARVSTSSPPNMVMEYTSSSAGTPTDWT